MLFGELAHINLDECIFATKDLLCQHSCKFCLAYSSWTHKHKRTSWPIGLINTATATPHRFRNLLHRFCLANDPLTKLPLQLHEQTAFRCMHLARWDACHMGHSPGNIIWR